MNILANKIANGLRVIRGECVMIDKYGVVYNCIDNAYHPNPGTAADNYSEIERTVDWLLQQNDTNIQPVIENWIYTRVAQELEVDPNIRFKDLMIYVMYSDAYQPCPLTELIIRRAFNELSIDDSRRIEFSVEDDVEYAKEITDYLNENFLRVRAGGKLNPEGTDSIYFRISSHGFNWYPIIIEFLWDAFGTPSEMPSYIWIGHDEETNPPEITLFEGTAEELFDQDQKIFAATII